MASHTSGPWHVGGHAYDIWVAGPEKPAKVVCTVVPRGRPLTGEDRANAALIAAAPDLLAALKLCEPALRRTRPADDWPRECELAAKAIARAEGSN